MRHVEADITGVREPQPSCHTGPLAFSRCAAVGSPVSRSNPAQASER
jgi:hypothetical protein